MDGQEVNQALVLFRSVEDVGRDAPNQEQLLEGLEVRVFCLVGFRQGHVVLVLRPVQPDEIVRVFPVQDGVDNNVGIFP
jgi:hypothetical protein